MTTASTIDVEVTEIDGASTYTSTQIAEELGIHKNKVSQYKARLKRIAHPAFVNYKPKDRLTEEQQSVLVRYKALSLKGVEGKELDKLLLIGDHRQELLVKILKRLRKLKKFSQSDMQIFETAIRQALNIDQDQVVL